MIRIVSRGHNILGPHNAEHIEKVFVSIEGDVNVSKIGKRSIYVVRCECGIHGILDQDDEIWWFHKAYDVETAIGLYDEEIESHTRGT